MWLWLSVAVAATPEIDVGGSLATDVRYRPFALEVGSWYQDLTVDPGFSRNQNTLNTRARIRSGNVGATLDLDLVYMGFSETPTEVADLAVREVVDPFRFETHSAYVEARDLGLTGLDVRFGQQLVQFGVGDQFNPTNNLNADDMEDPLRFGDQLGNVMLRVDYSPRGNWTGTLAVVPVFKPALLPQHGALRYTTPTALPFDEAELRWRIQSEQALAHEALGYPTVIGSLTPVLPENDLSNVQVGVNVGGYVGLHDVGLSYYRGRLDFPVPTAVHTSLESGVQCNPDDPEECIDGLLVMDVIGTYPRVQILGLNASGELGLLNRLTPKILPIGYRAEAALHLPERQTLVITQDALDLGFIDYPEGEYDYRLDGEQPTSMSDQPYLKWTLGLDYTLGRHVYLNAQWVHGMPDEHGAGAFWQPDQWVVQDAGVDSDLVRTTTCALEGYGDTCAWERSRPRIGDYLVLGTELVFGSTTFRFIGILDLIGQAEEHVVDFDRVRVRHGPLSKEGFSAAIFPELLHNFGNGLELGAGALVLIGTKESKFGDPALGGTQIFARGKYSF